MQLINNMLRPKSIENCVIRGLIMADANIKKLPNCINFVLENRVNIVGSSTVVTNNDLPGTIMACIWCTSTNYNYAI